jgi:hypothetical protein
MQEIYYIYQLVGIRCIPNNLSLFSYLDQITNTIHSKKRIVVEYTISRLKKYRIMSDIFRNKLRKYNKASDIVSGLVN